VTVQMMRWRQVFGFMVLALTLVGTLAHICVLPLHAHAAASTTESPRDHHDAATHDDHDGSGEDDAVHGASCEALRAPSVTTLIGPDAHPTQLAYAATPVMSGRVAEAPPPPSASPPLYLTHRALRI
jgi:hypothetical protein